MKAKKQKKDTRGLKKAKKLESQKPLLQITLKEVYITGVQTSGHS
ncbi:MAG TPA: hypothetical protein VMH00_07840 [Candidatus Limnocylindrales bacterium]|nr:hypothetical protein [Candidatus Limnocylindrales bacterium]